MRATGRSERFSFLPVPGAFSSSRPLAKTGLHGLVHCRCLCRTRTRIARYWLPEGTSELRYVFFNRAALAEDARRIVSGFCYVVCKTGPHFGKRKDGQGSLSGPALATTECQGDGDSPVTLSEFISTTAVSSSSLFSLLLVHGWTTGNTETHLQQDGHRLLLLASAEIYICCANTTRIMAEVLDNHQPPGRAFCRT